ncbi:MAG: TRAP transporter fused permease subunit, partial [Rhodospirillales bacterium]|nr:TRAP transporter fused permease subunit [Rhodospirillales bacterium]
MTEITRTDQEAAAARSDEAHYRPLSGWQKGVVVLLTFLSLILAINQLFNLQFFVGVVLLDNTYLYALAGIFIAAAFLIFPAGKRASMDRAPWYDLVLAATTLCVSAWFAWNGHRIIAEGWEYAAPDVATALSFVYIILILEATRRAGGFLLFCVVFVFALYPAFADKLPGPISGYPQPLPDTVAYHIISTESSFGIPMTAFGQLVIGFVVFGAALQQTGAGTFFNNLALALVGWLRGGAAKVAIFASGLMGSVSGSVVSNVLTTGVVSIPAMKRTGFSSPYAAGVEACASTGGVLMPPVMGTTAFVMASFLGIPYSEIAISAAIPSLLYYFGLFVQIDAYAARRGLAGIPRAELPRLGATFRDGWYYIAVFAVLIAFLLLLRQETLAPFYATAVLLVINQLVPKHRLGWQGFIDLFFGMGRGLAELVAVLAGVGLIIGAFSATGLAGTLANDLVFLAGDETLVLLVMGALTSFIFGMGMTVTACYIFLAIVLAPALTAQGLDPLAVHLFMLYWGMVSFITPPVALGAFAAATLARTNPVRAGLEAMRLGSIIYFVPFFFVLNPALIGRGSAYDIVMTTITAFIGIYVIGSALQGYAAGFGIIRNDALGILARGLLLLGGLAFAAPGNIGLGLNHIETSLIGLALAAP